jgi:pilus assembly protein CpaF
MLMRRRTAPLNITTTQAMPQAPAHQAPQPAPQPTAQSVAADLGDALKREVHVRLLDEADPTLFQQDPPAPEGVALVRRLLTEAAQRTGELVGQARLERLTAEMLNEISGLGPLEPLLADPSVSEIMVNSPSQVYIEREGRLMLTDIRFADDRHLLRVIDRVVSRVGRHIDEASPMCDARLPDGSRVNAVIPPLALNGPCMTIRKFSRKPLLAADLIARGAMSDGMVAFLQAAVDAELNILVSGGTGSGKTTFLNMLSTFIPTSERLITIEDAAELQLQQPHVLRLETRQANGEGQGAISCADLLRNSLRMRPDRIIVGEVRGSEAFSMLQAMNTGHEGSLTTIHANTCRDALSRLETMVLMAGMDLPHRAIREQISSAIDLIVQLERLPDGRRCVTQITELVGMESDVFLLQDLFKYQLDGRGPEGQVLGRHVSTGLVPACASRIQSRGGALSLHHFMGV